MATEDERKLFVAGLPESITEEVLRQVFEATGGKVVDVSLPKDRMTGRPRGFGFVTLSSPEEASNARASLDGSLQAGRPMSVRPFQAEAPKRGDGREGPPRPGMPSDRDRDRDREQPRDRDRDRDQNRDRDRGGSPGGGPGAGGGDRTLYVGNLPYDCSPQLIDELFQHYAAGAIARVHLPVGPDGRPRGFGFVTMASADGALTAIAALRDAELKGRRLAISVAHPRGAPGAERSDSRAPMGDRGPDSYRPSRDPLGERRPQLPPDPPPPETPEGEEGGGDRRRGEKPDKKKKKGARVEGKAAPAKRIREKDWRDWDDDES